MLAVKVLRAGCDSERNWRFDPAAPDDLIAGARTLNDTGVAARQAESRVATRAVPP